ncbi:hypothetical protein L202_07768 [Cryptococcus amylolentus CBS 6039]|uniref:Uncharacterized protein n=2 Tax=Cryptococcus amylolentus TaxID=104669 RepID=A0A1E3HA57_9TREE|nr:hypothetical protein L202_07768 [Cryptococcus amylolentus CBS 6039]ODN73209.1 hypothetical protein L202_07768 [Cryptococcus amylolentus CBS 6039]ODN99028.1 hypothetical protein I350_07180 [Cryptococcus amylolentus CBS 6273]
MEPIRSLDPLPDDILNVIFDHLLVLAIDDKPLGLALIRSSKQTFRRASPYLYRHVSLHSRNVSKFFLGIEISFGIDTRARPGEARRWNDGLFEGRSTAARRLAYLGLVRRVEIQDKEAHSACMTAVARMRSKKLASGHGKRSDGIAFLPNLFWGLDPAFGPHGTMLWSQGAIVGILEYLKLYLKLGRDMSLCDLGHPTYLQAVLPAFGDLRRYREALWSYFGSLPVRQLKLCNYDIQEDSREESLIESLCLEGLLAKEVTLVLKDTSAPTTLAPVGKLMRDTIQNNPYSSCPRFTVRIEGFIPSPGESLETVQEEIDNLARTLHGPSISVEPDVKFVLC